MGTFDHVDITDSDEETLDELRDAFTSLKELILSSTSPSRRQSLALTNLEQAAMWANKAFTHGNED